MNLYSENLLQKRAIKYMEQKYGKEAEFSIERGYAEEHVYKFYIKVKEHDDWDIQVYWDFEKKEFIDNYMSWVFQKQVEEAFYPIFREVYGDSKIFNVPYGFQATNQYNYDTKLEDYLTTVQSSTFDFFTCADPNDKEEDVLQFCENIKVKGWDVEVTIVYVSEKALLEIDKNNYETYLKNKEFICYSSVGVSKGRENFLEGWRKGGEW